MVFNSPFKVSSEEEMAQFGVALADQLQPGHVVYLRGDLGVGKTTLARSIIRALGFEGRVKSPSYGLIETYPASNMTVAHLDLYRLGDPAEVFDLGIEAYLDAPTVLLIEWPERGLGYLPKADWVVTIRDWPGAEQETDALATLATLATLREVTLSRSGVDPVRP